MTNVTVSGTQQAQDYRLVEAAIHFLQTHQQEQPSVASVANALHVSEGHLHRLFRKWVGLTPKQYLQTLTVDRAKQLLQQSRSLFDTALETGLSGSGRLHDHFVTLEAMTPAQYRRDCKESKSLVIHHGFTMTPFGMAFIGTTSRGICHLSFTDNQNEEYHRGKLAEQWPHAMLEADRSVVETLLKPLLGNWAGDKWTNDNRAGMSPRLNVLVKGTNFQVQVWRALLNIPVGVVVDYSQISAHIGRPSATRAAASAIGANPVALLIPCHRVIRRDGGLGGYRWGLPRKQMILTRELASA